MSDKTFKQQVIRIGNDSVCQDCNERSGCSLLPSGCVFLQEFVELIEALIAEEQKALVEALEEWKQVIADSYVLPIPVDRVQDMLDDLIVVASREVR